MGFVTSSLIIITHLSNKDLIHPLYDKTKATIPKSKVAAARVSCIISPGVQTKAPGVGGVLLVICKLCCSRAGIRWWYSHIFCQTAELTV